MDDNVIPFRGNPVPGTDLLSPVLNTEQAAAYVGLAKSTMEKLRVFGDSPVFTKYSTRIVRYRIEDLDAWIAAHRAASTSELEAA